MALFSVGAFGDYKITFKNNNIKVPEKVEQLKFVKVSAGASHSNALRNDGKIISWGSDDFESSEQDGFFIDVDSMTYKGLGVTESGKIISWNNSVSPTGSDYIQVSGGNYHAVAIKEDGALKSFGNDNYNQVKNTPSGNDYISVSAGSYHSIALKSNGSVVGWGFNYSGQAGGVSSNVKEISAGGSFNLALRNDGSIYAWGENYDGQVGDRPRSGVYKAVSAGFRHAYAITENGEIVGWGSDIYDQIKNIPPGNDFVDVAAGKYHGVALREDGTIVSWGYNSHGQVSETPTLD